MFWKGRIQDYQLLHFYGKSHGSTFVSRMLFLVYFTRRFLSLTLITEPHKQTNNLTALYTFKHLKDHLPSFF